MGSSDGPAPQGVTRTLIPGTLQDPCASQESCQLESTLGTLSLTPTACPALHWGFRMLPAARQKEVGSLA